MGEERGCGRVGGHMEHAKVCPQVENANVFKISQHVKQLWRDCFQMILSPFLLKKGEANVSRTRRADCVRRSFAPSARGEGQLQSNLIKKKRERESEKRKNRLAVRRNCHV